MVGELRALLRSFSLIAELTRGLTVRGLTVKNLNNGPKISGVMRKVIVMIV